MANTNIFVTGIAASAGGIEPMRDLLHHASCHESMAFVVVSHVARYEKTDLARILGRATNLESEEIVDGVEIRKCRLYTIPPNKYVEVRDGRLHLSPRPQGVPNNAADFFFESLARTYKANAIGVVLSGSQVGEDGSQGVRAIKKFSGHTYAQEPETADFPDMPRAAIATGCIDSVLKPEEIGWELSLVAWAN